MDRDKLIKRMISCYHECKKMQYTDKQAMERVLEIYEEVVYTPKDDCRYIDDTDEKEYYIR